MASGDLKTIAGILKMPITLGDLLTAEEPLGLWHGTRALIESSLVPGFEQLNVEVDLVRDIWHVIATKNRIQVGALESATAPLLLASSKGSEMHIGNTVRCLGGQFRYDCVAFATNRGDANAYAREGSELANAIRHFLRCAVADYGEEMSTSLQQRTTLAATRCDALMEGSPVVYRMRDLPPNGHFGTSRGAQHQIARDDCVSNNPIFPHPLPELFFFGRVPLVCLTAVDYEEGLF